ncbi:MAG: hypothetical protein CM15mP130_0210 [Verrucomicrobiota bacterium]|nr:MAG: hypothetical protein CM15mP130_0210 [Verrucomicrobiota bacterium]
MDVITRGIIRRLLVGVIRYGQRSHETKNLYDDPKHAKLVSSLNNGLLNFAKSGR